MSTPITKVEIGFFMPTGFCDTHFVDTDDRGLAIRTVMALYDQRYLPCVNTIFARHNGRDRCGGRPLLEPIKDSP